MEKISISTEYITLDKFLKYAGITDTGGQAKAIMEEEKIFLNGKQVFEKRKKIFPGDILEIRNIGKWKVVMENE